MVSKRRQIVERPSGTGKIFKDEQVIAKAVYLLDVFQAPIIAGTPPDVGGQINLVGEQKPDLRDGKYILELTDGRRWEFYTARGNLATGNYTVVMRGKL